MSALADRDTNAKMSSPKAYPLEKKPANGAENKLQRTLEQRIADQNK